MAPKDDSSIEEVMKRMDSKLVTLAGRAKQGGINFSVLRWKPEAAIQWNAGSNDPWIEIHFGGEHSISIHPEEADRFADHTF